MKIIDKLDPKRKEVKDQTFIDAEEHPNDFIIEINEVSKVKKPFKKPNLKLVNKK